MKQVLDSKRKERRSSLPLELRPPRAGTDLTAPGRGSEARENRPLSAASRELPAVLHLRGGLPAQRR